MKKERKPNVAGDQDDPIDLDSDESDAGSPVSDYINVTKVVEIGESIKKTFGNHYTFCKKPRSAYIYFVKAARLECKDKGSRENFVEISREISAKWKELKVNQRKVFDDCAVLDKRFNGFKIDAASKKKTHTGSHTSLFLKVRQEAREHQAAVTDPARVAADPTRALTSLLAARARATTSRLRAASSTTTTSRTRRKVKRKKTKKRKTTRRVKTERSIKRERKPVIKTERKLTIKSERKPLVKKERKVKRE